MAQDRSGVEAFPSDVIGIHNHGTIKIGDTMSDKEPLQFVGVPNFAPEHPSRTTAESAQGKQLEKGLLPWRKGAVQHTAISSAAPTTTTSWAPSGAPV